MWREDSISIISVSISSQAIYPKSRLAPLLLLSLLALFMLALTFTLGLLFGNSSPLFLIPTLPLRVRAG